MGAGLGPGSSALTYPDGDARSLGGIRQWTRAIGARLRILPRWRGLTLTELAGLSDLSPSFLSTCERGQRMLERRSHMAETERSGDVIWQQPEGAMRGKRADNAKVPVVKGCYDIGAEFSCEHDVHRVGQPDARIVAHNRVCGE